MASEEQLGILRKGFRSWNQWRKANPESIPDLSGAELSSAELRGADLTGADLTGADLTYAKLSGAQLNGADLTGANLVDADLGIHLEDHRTLFEAFGIPGGAKSLGITSLKGATLTGANLQGARLTSADLRDADLQGVNLTCAVIDSHSAEPGELLQLSGISIPANLTGTQLNRALLYKTTLHDAVLRKTSFHKTIIAATQFLHIDLSNATYLGDALHLAPANVDLDTLELTATGMRRVPSTEIEIFFRAAGVPSEYIESFRQRVSGASFYSCFISHSTADGAFCRKLYNRMNTEGLKVFYAPEDIKGGRLLHEQLADAIQSHDKLLLVLSGESMKSNWVELEIRKALDHEKQSGSRKLFPISVCNYDIVRNWSLIDADTGQDLAVRIRELFIPDFSSWQDDEAFEESFRRLIEDLRGSAHSDASPEPEDEPNPNRDGLFVRVWQ